jgi:hypothetical protein
MMSSDVLPEKFLGILEIRLSGRKHKLITSDDNSDDVNM